MRCLTTPRCDRPSALLGRVGYNIRSRVRFLANGNDAHIHGFSLPYLSSTHQTSVRLLRRSRFFSPLRNSFFLTGLAVLVAIGAVLYVLFDSLIMPGVTRHGGSTLVPDVMNLEFEDANRRLEEVGLSADYQLLRRPNLPRNIVVDQRPPAGATVKPGRRIYLTINTGDTTTVAVPKVLGLSLREAQSRMILLGLVVPTVTADTIPSSHPNTVTRQEPAAGFRVPQGSEVALWYSTGLGDRYVAVPDVTGLTPEEARSQLLALRLRSVLLGESEAETETRIIDQSPKAGTQVREGFEVRLRITPTEAEADTPENGEAPR